MFRRIAPFLEWTSVNGSHKGYDREPLDILVATNTLATLRWIDRGHSRLHGREHLYEHAAYAGNMELFQMLCDKCRCRPRWRSWSTMQGRVE